MEAISPHRAEMTRLEDRAMNLPPSAEMVIQSEAATMAAGVITAETAQREGTAILPPHIGEMVIQPEAAQMSHDTAVNIGTKAQTEGISAQKMATGKRIIPVTRRKICHSICPETAQRSDLTQMLTHIGTMIRRASLRLGTATVALDREGALGRTLIQRT
jgi:hypothetical protein